MKALRISTLMLLSAMLFTTAQGQVATAVPVTANTYTNPVISSSNADPSYRKAEDGYFYIYATGENIYRSKNLTSWSYVGKVFANDNHPVYTGPNYFWAPSANYINGQYVLYFAIGNMGGTGDDFYIGVATSNSPNGPFNPYDNPETAGDDKGVMFYSSQVGVPQSIDPCYFEEDGKKYIFFGSYNSIYAMELRDDGLALKDNTKIQIGGSAYEGTYIYKRGKYYYFFGSNGSCCSGASSTYRTVYGRSESLLGPYVTKSGEKMLDNKFEVLIQGNDKWAGTGHNAEIVDDKEGNSWIIYHAYSKKNPEIGRMDLLDQVHWTDDGWPYVTGGCPSVRAKSPSF